MSIKIVLLSVAALVISGSLFAQDKIFKRDGEVVEAKIKSVGTKTITYTRFDNQSGPDYTVIKNEVSKIKYQSGEEDVFDEHRPGPHHHSRSSHRVTSSVPQEDNSPKEKYGANLLTLAPIQFTENGLGLSLAYERTLDKAGIITFYFPLMATFNLNNGTYYNNVTGRNENGHQDAMYYLMPGIKLYPTGCNGRVKYGIGPSLVYASGEKSTSDYNYTTGNTNYTTKPHVLLGMMLSNSLNINPTPKIYLGLEFGLGFTYLNRVDGLNQGTNGIVQGGFKIGYRF